VSGRDAYVAPPARRGVHVLALVRRSSFVSIVVLATLSRGDADAAPPPPVAALVPASIELEADADDDDADGREDGASPSVTGHARRDVIPLPAFAIGKRVEIVSALGGARVLVGGKPLTLPAFAPNGAELQGVRATDESAKLLVGEGARAVSVPLVVRAHGFEDQSAAPISATSSHLSFSRALPDLSPASDPDGFRITVRGEKSAPVDVVSLGTHGAVLGRIVGVPLDAPCAARNPQCQRSRPLRLVVDSVDGNHPGSLGRSLVAEVGGLVLVVRDGKKLTSIHVGGPRGNGATAGGPFGALGLRVRATLFRAEKTGKPALFANEPEAIAEVRKDLADARALWSQCGVSLEARDADVRIASPPPPSLVAFGNDLGLPSSGGTVRVLVEGKKVEVTLPAGRTPLEAAFLFAEAVEKAGFVTEVSRNARIAPGAMGSADVRITKKGHRASDGPAQAARVDADGTLSSDATLSVAIGVVDLSDGLTHFGDMDSPAGTLEERSLVKSLDDRDPRTVNIVYVPYFAGGGRIGESFIHGDGSSVRNVIVVDRSGVRSRKSSHAIAHELGHVLLDVPGHPDDFGRDTPNLLMDSDASDASVYGPRRLTNEECARVVTEAGPRSKAPLLEPLRFGVVPIPSLR